MMRIISVVATMAVLSAGHAFATPAGATPDTAKTRQVFDIIRDGTPIGTNTIEIERRDDSINVKIATSISVKVMFIEAYRYEHKCTETWKAGQLIAFKSKTNDNGTNHVIDVVAKPDKLIIEVDGKRSDAPRSLAPASLWTKAVINQPELFEPANGKRLQVQVKDLGEESLSLNGMKRKTEHYQITAGPTGDFDRDLWFDGDTLVRMKLTGSDQSTILSDLRPTP